MRNWLVYVERDAAPGQFFHYEREAKKGRPLFVTRPALQEAPLVPMQPQVVRSRDGLDLVCYLSRPRDAQAGHAGADGAAGARRAVGARHLGASYATINGSPTAATRC